MSEFESQKIRDREQQENAPYLAAAAATQKPVTFIAADGCEVTCLPNGHVFLNASDWL